MFALTPSIFCAHATLDGPKYRYAVGPLIGGYIGELMGDAAPALVTVVLFAVLVPVTLIFLPETSPMQAGLGDQMKGKVQPMASFQGDMGDSKLSK